MTEINWGQLKKAADDATKPAPPGDYPFEITKATHKLNSSGNPMISVQCRIIGGDAEGKTVFNNFNVTPGSNYALAIFFRHMEALGFNDAYFASLGANGLDRLCADLVGRRGMFTLSVRAWQGVDRNQVDDIKPLDGLMAAALPASSAPSSSPSMMTGSGAPTPPIPPIPPTPPRVPTPTTTAPPTPFD